MIQILREYSKDKVPAAFCSLGRIAKQRLLLDAVRAGTAPQDLQFESRNWKTAKQALRSETGGKCAYCEAPAGGRTDDEEAKGGLVAHCDVEHFRPKDLYWWMAHNFENYAFACQICNQSFKGNKFPAAVRLPMPFAITGQETDAELDALADVMAPDPLDATRRGAWTQLLLSEDADVLDPVHEDPSSFFQYTADDVLEEVSIAPRAATGRKHARAQASIEVLGLWREELRHARYDVYTQVETIKLTLEEPVLSETLRRRCVRNLRRAMRYHQPFAGMVRYFVHEVWRLEL